MIEILPADIARGLQLVGLDLDGESRIPSRAMVAIRDHSWNVSEIIRAVWLEADGADSPSTRALNDLVCDGLPASPSSRSNMPVSSRCPVCAQEAPRRVLLQQGGAICPQHLADLWLRLAIPVFPNETRGVCAFCGEAVPFLWREPGVERCTACLARALIAPERPHLWVLVGGPLLPEGAIADMKVFLGVWKTLGKCERCGSKALRLRKILLDPPRTRGPLYPLWEIGPEDRSPEAEGRRERQLEIYTRGAVRVTLECPQCGYLEREFPAAELDLGGGSVARTEPVIPGALSG